MSEKGRSPLPERIDEIQAKHLLNVEWGDFAGKKTRVGVLEVDNNSSASTYKVTDSSGNTYESEWNVGGGTVPVNGIEAIVTDTMNRTGRFRLVERAALGDVLGEQDLATSGRVAKPSAAATGQVLGAEILVQVVITDYEENTSGKRWRRWRSAAEGSAGRRRRHQKWQGACGFELPAHRCDNQ